MLILNEIGIDVLGNNRKQHRRLDQADDGTPKHPQPARRRRRAGRGRLIEILATLS